jgi:hypothetical protein
MRREEKRKEEKRREDLRTFDLSVVTCMCVQWETQ